MSVSSYTANGLRYSLPAISKKNDQIHTFQERHTENGIFCAQRKIS